MKIYALIIVLALTACDRKATPKRPASPPAEPTYSAEEVASMLNEYYQKHGVLVCCVACHGVPVCGTAVQTPCGSCDATERMP